MFSTIIKYALSRSQKEQLTEQVEIGKNKFESLIDDFYETSSSIEKEKLKNLIYRFVYYCIDKNKQSIICMLGNGVKCSSLTNIGDFVATTDEKEAINAFLNWENTSKNKYLFNFINAAMNYGMLTVKKEMNDIFTGKKFLLDANVIIGLAGIGSPSRVTALSTFENKCNAIGIPLHYTTTTSDEINKLLLGKTTEIFEIIKSMGNVLITPSDMEEISGEKTSDFYSIYYEWAKTNDFANINQFHKYLNERIQSTLIRFKLVNTSEASLRKKTNFQSYADELSFFKKEKKGNSSDIAAETDVINYLYVENLTNNEQASIWSNWFLITLDRVFCSWAESKRSTFISLVIHPMIWLGLFLKYSSRTENDYSAFTKFLQLPVEHSLNTPIQKVLEVVSRFTGEPELRSKLITELASGAHNTPFFKEIDLEQATQKAFDVVIHRLNQEHDKKMIETKQTIKEEAIDYHHTTNENIVAQQANKNVNKKIRKWEWIFKNKKSIFVIAPIILSVFIILSLFITQTFEKIASLFNSLSDFNQYLVSILSSLLIPAFAYFLVYVMLKMLIKKSGSIDQIKKKIFDREYKKIRKKHHIFL